MSRARVRILPAGDWQPLEPGRPVVVGRSREADLQLADDALASGLHARLTALADAVGVEDLGSRNGTFLNGARIAGLASARSGDTVGIGATELAIEIEPPTVPDAPAAPAGGARFVVEVEGSPGAQPQVFELTGPTEIGRDATAGISLPADDLVSWRHARLRSTARGVLVEDLGSRNGVFVDGERLESPTEVPAGTRILVGRTTLHLRGATHPPAASVLAVVVAGPAAGRQATLTGPTVVGRDALVGLSLGEDVHVSRRHARLVPQEDAVAVEDLGSRNGTFVNGTIVHGVVVARPGDRIVVGSSALELRRLAHATRTAVAERPALPATEERPVLAGAPAREPSIGPTAAEAARPPHPAPAQASAGAPPADEPSSRRLGTFLISAFALFMAVLDNLVVLFALPSIQDDLNATVQDLEWTVNAFTLAFAVFLLPAATVGDRFGRRKVFAAGIALFTLASVACALAPSIEALLVARAVQGAGAAVVTPLSLTVLSAAFPVERRGIVLGAWSGIAGLAIAIGPVIGGLIVTGITWQWIFWLNVPIGAVIAPLCLIVVRESFGASVRLDVPGILLSGVGLLGLVFGVIRASAVGWGSLEVVVPLAGGALLVAAFVAWELRAASPMLAMGLFRSRAFSAANASSFCMYLGLFGVIFLLSQFLQLVQGYSALEAGVRSLPWTGMPIVVAPLAGALAERIGGRLPMALGLGLEAAAFAWLALVVEPGMPYGQLVGPLVLGGIGLGLFFAPVAHVVLGSVGLEQEGQASGANNAIRQVGGVVGVAVMATIFTSFGSVATPTGFVDGLVPPLWVAVGALVVGAAIALLIPRQRDEVGAVSMTSSVVPAAGGFTPGATIARTVVPPPRRDAAPERC